MDDKELRLKCLEFANNGMFSDSIMCMMINAEMLYRYISTGELPVKGNSDAFETASCILEAALEELKKKVPDGNQSSDGSNDNSDKLPVPKSFIKRFLSGFRREFNKYGRPIGQLHYLFPRLEH